MGRRIGLFGGTFDPPHMGHLAAALAAKEALGLDEVLFVVANDPWQKSGQRPITEARHRLAMTELLVEDADGIEASDAEILRGGESYMIDTVSDMRQRGHEITLIVGADVADGLELGSVRISFDNLYVSRSWIGLAMFRRRWMAG